MATTPPNISAAYQFFVEALAARRHESAGQVMAEISGPAFLATVERLQRQREAGELSLGHMAERLGLTTFQLDHLLTLLGLPIHP